MIFFEKTWKSRAPFYQKSMDIQLPLLGSRVRGAIIFSVVNQGVPVKLDSMWQHRLTRLVRDRYMYSIYYYRIIFKQNPFNIISRGVQR